MLETIAIVLSVLWGLGLATSYSLGSFTHLLLVAAVVVVAGIGVMQDRRVA